MTVESLNTLLRPTALLVNGSYFLPYVIEFVCVDDVVLLVHVVQVYLQIVN